MPRVWYTGRPKPTPNRRQTRSQKCVVIPPPRPPLSILEPGVSVDIFPSTPIPVRKIRHSAPALSKYRSSAPTAKSPINHDFNDSFFNASSQPRRSGRICAPVNYTEELTLSFDELEDVVDLHENGDYTFEWIGKQMQKDPKMLEEKYNEDLEKRKKEEADFKGEEHSDDNEHDIYTNDEVNNVSSRLDNMKVDMEEGREEINIWQSTHMELINVRTRSNVFDKPISSILGKDENKWNGPDRKEQRVYDQQNGKLIMELVKLQTKQKALHGKFSPSSPPSSPPPESLNLPALRSLKNPLPPSLSCQPHSAASALTSAKDKSTPVWLRSSSGPDTEQPPVVRISYDIVSKINSPIFFAIHEEQEENIDSFEPLPSSSDASSDINKENIGPDSSSSPDGSESLDPLYFRGLHSFPFCANESQKLKASNKRKNTADDRRILEEISEGGSKRSKLSSSGFVPLERYTLMAVLNDEYTMSVEINKDYHTTLAIWNETESANSSPGVSPTDVAYPGGYTCFGDWEYDRAILKSELKKQQAMRRMNRLMKNLRVWEAKDNFAAKREPSLKRLLCPDLPFEVSA